MDVNSSFSFPASFVLQQIPDMVFVMSVHSLHEFRYAFMNPSAMQASGLNEYAYGATFHDVVEPAEADFLYTQYTRAFMEGQSVSFVLDHEGQIGESVISPIRDENGKFTHIIGLVRDITERVHREKHLEYLAFRDQLTGLFNRHAIVARLKDAVQKASHEGQILSILLLDCDNLKMINDRYGHLVGDLMLKEVASRLEKSIPSAHTIARVGGDEFLIVVLVKCELEIFDVAESVLAAIRLPWSYEDNPLHILVSIGIGMYPIDSMDIHEVVKTADNRLYLAKEMGGNQYMLDQTIK